MKLTEISIDIILAPITNTTYSRPSVYKQVEAFNKIAQLLFQESLTLVKMAGWLVFNSSFKRLQCI